ncbi:MAG: DUF4419 domain-containing protein [Planctomycetota bacterium]|nr:DUF4419 domain-containing protein [Planctomycetota bacterium]
MVAHVDLHPVIGAAQFAFHSHRPLVLSPDIVWLMIAQGFASHVNANAETLRPQLVKHSGKCKIKVERNDFVKGSPENPWTEVFDEFAGQIREHVGETTHELLLPTFSTTGVVERAAAQLAILEALAPFFEYEFHTMCGIPQIVLEGTADDWDRLAERTQNLGQFGLSWWTDSLAPILGEFCAAVRGQVNCRFWQSLYKRDDESGGPYVTGWITSFFPYLKHHQTGQPTIKNYNLSRYSASSSAPADATEPSTPQDLPWEIGGPMDRLPKSVLVEMALRRISLAKKETREFGGRCRVSDFPSGVSRVPLQWMYYGSTFPMEMLGGFVGISQEPESLRLRPEIGWAIRESTID